jgi:hypothetical protein
VPEHPTGAGHVQRRALETERKCYRPTSNYLCILGIDDLRNNPEEEEASVAVKLGLDSLSKQAMVSIRTYVRL